MGKKASHTHTICSSFNKENSNDVRTEFHLLREKIPASVKEVSSFKEKKIHLYIWFVSKMWLIEMQKNLS